MIGSGLKKIVNANAMKIDKGVGYGSFRGYAVTLSEGAGWKRMSIATVFSDVNRKYAFKEIIDGVDILKQYRVRELKFYDNAIDIRFNDTYGTMKKIEAFIDWFFPLLDESSASKADICTHCGFSCGSDVEWVLVNGIAHPLHPSCAVRVKEEISTQQVKKDEYTGSYASGFIGALVGALLGAVVWAIVFSLGYMASVVGILIGFLAEKGYRLFRGKNGKGKLAVIVIVTVLAVVVGTFGGETLGVMKYISSGEIQGFTYADAFPFVMYVISVDASARSVIIGNILEGIMFAGLGVWVILRNVNKEVSGVKVVDLK